MGSDVDYLVSDTFRGIRALYIKYVCVSVPQYILEVFATSWLHKIN